MNRIRPTFRIVCKILDEKFRSNSSVCNVEIPSRQKRERIR